LPSGFDEPFVNNKLQLATYGKKDDAMIWGGGVDNE